MHWLCTCERTQEKNHTCVQSATTPTRSSDTSSRTRRLTPANVRTSAQPVASRTASVSTSGCISSVSTMTARRHWSRRNSHLLILSSSQPMPWTAQPNVPSWSSMRELSSESHGLPRKLHAVSTRVSIELANYIHDNSAEYSEFILNRGSSQRRSVILIGIKTRWAPPLSFASSSSPFLGFLTLPKRPVNVFKGVGGSTIDFQSFLWH